MDKIKFFYHRHIFKVDRYLLVMYGIMLAIGLMALAVNWLVTGYPGNNYLPSLWYFLAPFVLIMLVVAWYARDISPRLAMFTRFYTLYFIFSFCLAVILNGIQYSDFATIDAVLVKWDEALGIDTPALIAWTAHHPTLKLLFEIAYSAVSLEVMLLPALLAILHYEKQLNEYLLVLSVVAIVGSLIYYFFPTAAPVSVYNSDYFLSFQHDTVLKFRQIHSYIQPTTKEGGMIAFPSFHVIWALMCAWVLREKWWLFLPIALINFIAIVSTVMLGWHYLVDVISAVFIAFLGVFFVKRFFLSGKNNIEKLDGRK